MPFRRTSLLALSALFFAAPLAAQDVVPGLRLAPGAVQPGVRHYRVAFDFGSNRVQEVGSFTDELRAVEHEGRPALLRVGTFQSPQGTVADTAIAVAATMAPLVHRSHQGVRTMVLAFDGARVRSTVTPQDSAARTEEKVYDVAMFDAGAIEVVLGALPLAEGFTATLPFYVHEAGGLVRMEARVVGREVPPALPGAGPAWKVTLTYPGAPATYWIDDATRRMVVTEMMRGGAILRVSHVPAAP